MTNPFVPASQGTHRDIPPGQAPLSLALPNPAIQELLADASGTARSLTINSSDAARPLLLAALATRTPLLVVTATGHEGE